MSHIASGYVSDLSDTQWAIIEHMIPVYKWGPPHELDMRRVVNAPFYLDKTGWYTLRSDDVSGFEVILWRSFIERTFAWLGYFRRLSKDYEFFCENSESMLYIASIHRIVRRLAPVT